jgi:hypothetical protein
LQYVTRWLIEEYHKCLKTGLGADVLQLETADRLFAAISVMAVVAVRLLAMKEGARVEPDAPAKVSGLSVFELRVLRLILERELRSVWDVALALGRLGIWIESRMVYLVGGRFGWGCRSCECWLMECV